MNREDRYKITSNEYADLMVQGLDTINALSNDPNISVLTVDNRYGVAYLPVENMTSDSVQKFGYTAIPKIYGLLSFVSLESSGVNQVRSDPAYNLRGQGVLVGLVDTGIDYTNLAFRNSDRSTRIVSIWDQTIDSDNYPDNFFYGTEFSRDEINNALRSQNPFLILPSTDRIGHGTMLAGVAAGTENTESSFSGVAPDSELVIVKLKEAKPYLRDFFRIRDGVLGYQENDILMGISYLLEVAEGLNRPMVICLGVGTNQGSHEGRSILSNYLRDIGNYVGYSIVTAAGNEGNRGHHYFGEINPARDRELVSLNVAENETGFSVELWGYVPNVVELDIYSPDFEFVTHVPSSLGPQETAEVVFGDTTILIDNQVSETVTGDQLILMRFQNPLAGIWRFVVSGTSDLTTRFHLWLPMYNYISENTYFFNSDSNTSISDEANTTNVITVTAYDPVNETLFYNTSRGFTKNSGLKPDIAAPGVNILAPAPGNTITRATGTGIAASHTAGAAAMLLEWGIVRGNLRIMNNVIIRRMLISGARRYSNIPYPNQDWGFGILDIYNTLVFF